MAVSKLVKVEACTFCSVKAGQTERKWGFDFTAVDVNGSVKLIAEMSAEDAANFIKHGQCVKA